MKHYICLFWFFALWTPGYLSAGSSLGETTTTTDAEVVVLLHGLGRTRTAMWLLADRLADAGYEVRRVGYSSLKTTLTEMIETVTTEINDCCATEERTVHFVGHSLGGLLIRAYLQTYRPPSLGNTVLVWTPNSGSEIADRFKDHGLIEYLLPATTDLGTDSGSLPNRLPPPDYPVGIIAGVSDSELSEYFFPGPNDGLVEVESTRLEGMVDFIEIQTGHSMMRYDKEVADQVINFLTTGRFSPQ